MAKARAMMYSTSSTLVKPKALARKGTSQTRVVSTKLPAAAMVRGLVQAFMLKRLPRCERILKLWKISACSW